jgi:hypothetical protein
MHVTEFPGLADHVRTLPAEGAGRDRHLHRLIDLYASAEATGALRFAAAHPGPEQGALDHVLRLAARVLRDDLARRDTPADDEAYDQLRAAVATPAFLSLFEGEIRGLREIASSLPETGACTLATALELWTWTMQHFLSGDGSRGEWSSRAADELAETLVPLLASRCLILEVAAELSSLPQAEPELRPDLARVFVARASASAGAACAELVFGYRRHLVWDSEGCRTCYEGDALDDLEAFMPGLAAGARMSSDVIEADGAHPAKAGPCARFDGVDRFMQLRNRLDGCLTGARIARDRAALAMARFMADTILEGRA